MKVYMFGETRLNENAIGAYLADRGYSWESNGVEDVDALIELYGRGCYDSFEGTKNRNITKIRKNNEEYIGNILKVKHGSVLEHVTFNFMFTGVSRVLTHELVRHRQGVAISQQSGRYVTANGSAFKEMFIPPEFEMGRLRVAWDEAVDVIGDQFDRVADLVESYCKDQPFDVKKKMTSALRRLAPNGMLNNIGWTVNARALRFVLEQRTAPSAEVEIRQLFNMVWTHVQHYECMQSETEMIDGFLHIKAGKI